MKSVIVPIGGLVSWNIKLGLVSGRMRRNSERKGSKEIRNVQRTT